MHNILGLFAVFISASALFSYINHRWLKLPRTIGVMLISVVLGITLKIVGLVDHEFVEPITRFLERFNFSSFVLDFILCFLLFAGSLHVNINDLRGVRATVLSYSVFGTIISTVLVGVFAYLVIHLAGLTVGLLPCFLFGALISPTDPISVIGILSKFKIPTKLRTEIIGESLFNDGIGVVLFTVIFSLLTSSGDNISVGYALKILIKEAGGGILFGVCIGYVGFMLLRSIDHYQTEIMVTLALVTGGYTIASLIHFSGPLAMVIAGLIIGNKARKHAMSDVTEEYVDKFWELIDEICNTVLFLLMGLQIFLIPINGYYIGIGIILIIAVLVSRFISLLPTFLLFNKNEPRIKLNLVVLTWAGLRGGISIALALSIAGKIEGSSAFIVSTYVIVIFSILVQGLSINKLLARY